MMDDPEEINDAASAGRRRAPQERKVPASIPEAFTQKIFISTQACRAGAGGRVWPSIRSNDVQGLVQIGVQGPRHCEVRERVHGQLQISRLPRLTILTIR